ncbi:MAG TPA: AarF/ABC1/UbiB kinase family protein [Desulfosalsimonadaceae bacterium]|nr:AarF/ABC1/UbiB kinase family protein [Desulfosalsimonadaceae bacterium]
MAKKLIRSATQRMFRLGGLAGRVGVSMAGNTMANFFRDSDRKDEYRVDTLLKNAQRVTEQLGQLKGVPMKIGQMLSLHDNLFPKEVIRVFKSLQQQAPSVPFEEMLAMIRDELGPAYKNIAHIDKIPLASASIGQVHRAVLTDGREIVLKVQYPGIDEVIRSDLKNLKGILKRVFSMFTRMDMEEIWQELNARLLEELDYENEAGNMRRVAENYKDDARVIVPQVIDEMTSRHVLGMELVLGISSADATSEDYSEKLRSAWGVSLITFALRGLFEFKFLHADPNLANFAFLENGGIIVYDFGCMKEVPAALCTGYAQMVEAVLNHEYPRIPEILKSMGVHKASGEKVSWEMAKDFADVFQEIIDTRNHFTFGEDADIYSRLISLGHKYVNESMSFIFPKDVIFIDRTFSGHFGNLCHLKARADWRALLIEQLASAGYPIKQPIEQ